MKFLDPTLHRWLLKKRDPWISRSSLLVPFYVNLLPDISGLSVSTSHWWKITCCSLTTLCSCVSVAARAAHLALSFVLHWLSLCSAVSAAWRALTRLFLCFHFSSVVLSRTWSFHIDYQDVTSLSQIWICLLYGIRIHTNIQTPLAFNTLMWDSLSLVPTSANHLTRPQGKDDRRTTVSEFCVAISPGDK